MKRLAFALALLVPVLAFAAGTIKRGAPLSDAKPTPIADVVKSPENFTAKSVLVEGTVNNVCAQKGCWMELEGMHVTFKDYGFFVPKNAKGYAARAEGVTSIEKLSKDEADHLAGEGAKLNRNPDGTATQVTFIASGVELTANK
ncbi:MAG TPA: DUF4920 domain-containing protein [Thermoanaerobaculia bacterium]|nr:DUF4920 domain-containing protein [Thermoanaerobaculia bacterium]